MKVADNMNPGTPSLLRAIPPRLMIAWLLRYLVPDGLWNDFDIGAVRAGQIGTVQQQLLERGGENAWLRFVEQTRVALPRLLSISLFEVLGSALGGLNVWPQDVWLHCSPFLSVYAAGRLLAPITLNCHARLAFSRSGERRTGDYALATTEVTPRHARQCLIERVTGEYFVPVPPVPATALSARRFKVSAN